jgi:hypothetical protein
VVVVPDRITVASAFELFRLAEQNIATVCLEDLFGATYLKEPEEYTQYGSVWAPQGCRAEPGRVSGVHRQGGRGVHQTDPVKRWP